MTKIVMKPIPNGRVPFEHNANPQAKDAVMRLNDNMAALAEQVKTLQLAVQELQRR